MSPSSEAILAAELRDERGPLLWAIGWMLIATAVLISGIYAAVGAPWPAVVSLAMAALWGVLVWILAVAPGRCGLVARASTATLFVGVAGISVLTGGWHAPATLWLVLVPMVATLTESLRTGLVWGVIAALTLAGLRAALAAELPLPDPLSASAHQWLGLAGDVLFVGLAMSILGRYDHAHRHLVEALRRARDGALEASRGKSTFLASMSHEVRTPMNAVIGMSELLLAGDLALVQRERTETIRSSAESLLQVINDILDFSKLDSGRLELESVPFQPGEVVWDVVDLLAPRAAEKSLVLLCDAPTHLCVSGDPHRFRQVVVNLVGNALKFTAEGEVEVRLSLREEEEIGGGPGSGAGEPVGRQAGGVAIVDEPGAPSPSKRCGLCLAIQDTGIGIAPEAQQQVFEPFVQESASTTRRFGGTGLGLAISRQIVEAMGGSISVQSQPGVGTRVEVRLALPRLQDSPLPQAAGPLGALRVLVGEAHARARESLLAALEGMGVVALGAATPEEGLRLLDGAGHDIDVLLWPEEWPPIPSTGGGTASGRPRSPPSHVVVVARGTSCGEGGGEAWLTRPVRPSRLWRRLRTNPLGATPSPVPPVPGAVPPMRVLVAEDNAVNQRVVGAMLRHLGAEAVVVGDGQAALDLLAREHFDLVLMDAEMPIVDGEAAVRRLRSWPDARRDTPVVALTAHALVGDRERFLAAGMNDHLPKPVTLHALSRVLGRWAPAAPSAEAVRAQLDANLQSLRNACAEALTRGDVDATARAARRLRSAALWAGEVTLAEACAALETAGEPHTAKAAWAAVEVALKRL